MMPDAIGPFVGMAFIVVVFMVVGMKMRFNHRSGMREMSGGEREGLIEAVQQLQDEVGSMREEFGELQERVDFTERMLSEIRARNSIGSRESDPD
jgi:hypothetical protein